MASPVSDFDEAVRALQHTVNCVLDQSRLTRKLALEKLGREIPTLASNTEVFPRLFRELLLPVLLKAFHDPLERCRLLAVQCVQEALPHLFCKGVEDLDWFIRPLVRTVWEREGQQQTVEPSEELRFLLVQLFKAMLERAGACGCAASLKDSWTKLVDVCLRAANDGFPALKKEASAIAILFVQLTAIAGVEPNPEKLDEHLSVLAKGVSVNLRHQHARVRIAALDALSSLFIRAGPKLQPWAETLLSQVATLVFDRSPLVREDLVKVVFGLLGTLQLDGPEYVRLLVVALGTLADDIPQVQNTACRALCEFGEAKHGKIEEDEPRTEWLPQPLALPFPCRPARAVRELVAPHFEHVLQLVLKGTVEWTSRLRGQAACVLRVLLVVTEQAATAHVPRIVSVLLRAVNEDDKEVFNALTAAVQVLGFFVPCQAWLNELSRIMEATPDRNVLHASGVLLSALVSGLHHRPLALASHVAPLALLLSQCPLAVYTDPAVVVPVLEVVHTLVSTVPKVCAEDVTALLSTNLGRLFWTLHRVETTLQAPFSAVELCHRLRAQLADAAQRTEQQLYSLFFADGVRVLCEASSQESEADGSSQQQLLFRWLLCSGPAVGEHFGLVQPLLVACTAPNRPPTVRMGTLQTLYELLKMGGEAWSGWMVSLAKSLLMPSLVWSPGRVSAAIRREALACLLVSFDQNMWNTHFLDTVRVELVPLVQASLDDDDPAVRVTVCRLLRHVFTTTEVLFQHEQLTLLSRELLKRLDDSNDVVRVTASAALQVLVTRWYPPAEQYDPEGAHANHMIQCCLPHLGDMNPDVQHAVCELLKAFAPFNPTQLRKVPEVLACWSLTCIVRNSSKNEKNNGLDAIAKRCLRLLKRGVFRVGAETKT